jgi:hypothetical protein
LANISALVAPSLVASRTLTNIIGSLLDRIIDN